MNFLKTYQSVFLTYGAFLVTAYMAIVAVQDSMRGEGIVVGLAGLLVAQATGVYGIKKITEEKTAQVTASAQAPQ